MFQLFGQYIRHTFSTWVNEGPNYEASTISDFLPTVVYNTRSKWFFSIEMLRYFTVAIDNSWSVLKSTKIIVEFSKGGKILAALLGRGLEMEVEGNPVAHLQRTKRVCVSKCSYMEIGYPLPCDSHVWIHDGYREDVLEVKVRIVTDQPAEGGDLRFINLKLKTSNSLELKVV